MTFCDIRALRCTLYHLQLLHYIPSEGVRWFAPIYDARDSTTPLLLSGFRALWSDRPCTYVLLRACIRWAAYRKYVHMYWKYLHTHMTCTQRRGIPSINSIIKIGWINAIGTVRSSLCIVGYWYRYIIVALAMYIRDSCSRDTSSGESWVSYLRNEIELQNWSYLSKNNFIVNLYHSTRKSFSLLLNYNIMIYILN